MSSYSRPRLHGVRRTAPGAVHASRWHGSDFSSSREGADCTHRTRRHRGGFLCREVLKELLLAQLTAPTHAAPGCLVRRQVVPSQYCLRAASYYPAESSPENKK